MFRRYCKLFPPVSRLYRSNQPTRLRSIVVGKRVLTPLRRVLLDNNPFARFVKSARLDVAAMIQEDKGVAMFEHVSVLIGAPESWNMISARAIRRLLRVGVWRSHDYPQVSDRP